MLYGQFKDVQAVRLKNFVLLELAVLMKKLRIENAVDAIFYPFEMLPFIRNHGIGKCDGLLFHLHHPVGIVDLTAAAHQHDLIEVAATVWDAGRVTGDIRLVTEDVKVPNIATHAFLHRCELAAIKFGE